MSTQTKMEYEIIEPGSGDPAAGPKHPRVRIDGAVYPLRVTGGSELEPRQLRQVERGDYGALPQAYLAAAREAGIPPLFGWSGVVNAMGDHGSVSIPRRLV